jgi:hypothetical protein
MQAIFIISVIGLTVSCLLPIFGGRGVSWNEGITRGFYPFGLAVIVSWILSSGLRPKDDPSGKKFGLPRIRWRRLGLWCIIVGLIVSVGALMEAGKEKSSIVRGAYSSSYDYYGSRLEDAHRGEVLGAIITGVGMVSFTFAAIQAARKRRRIRLEI